jgi:hypothetical protein
VAGSGFVYVSQPWVGEGEAEPLLETASLLYFIVFYVTVVVTQGVTKRCRLSWLTNRRSRI